MTFCSSQSEKKKKILSHPHSSHLTFDGAFGTTTLASSLANNTMSGEETKKVTEEAFQSQKMLDNQKALEDLVKLKNKRKREVALTKKKKWPEKPKIEHQRSSCIHR